MSGSNEWGLMKIALNAAVPLRIEELRHKPIAEILDPERLNSIQRTLDEAREDVLFGGKGCAEGFNAVADAIARLAFMPGGVDFMGMHFEEVPCAG